MSEIETRNCESAAEFLEAIRRSNSKWLPEEDWESPWVFRGQNNANWKLEPTAWRTTVFENATYKRYKTETWERDVTSLQERRDFRGVDREQLHAYVTQCYFEKGIVVGFYHILDQLGLSLPGGKIRSTSVDATLTTACDECAEHPAFALAQHHGIPTRLLDWTYSPEVAAFWAAYKEKEDPEGELAVWALNLYALEHSHTSNWRRLTIENSLIGFLRAQEGLFTYRQLADQEFVRNGKWPSLEGDINAQYLRKLTLPRMEAPVLLRLLYAERVSLAHLMPTYDNASKAVR